MSVRKVLKSSEPTRELGSVLRCFEKYYGNMRMDYNNPHWLKTGVKNYKRHHKDHMISSKRPLVCLLHTGPYCI
jgi:hypothetical protein